VVAQAEVLVKLHYLKVEQVVQLMELVKEVLEELAEDKTPAEVVVQDPQVYLGQMMSTLTMVQAVTALHSMELHTLVVVAEQAHLETRILLTLQVLVDQAVEAVVCI
jgi:hypothetical protein